MESWKKAKKGPHALLPFNTVPFTYRNAAAEATEIPEKRSIGHLSRPTKPKISRLITRRLIECRSSRGRASPLSISYARRGGEGERERESGSLRIFRSHSYSCVGNSLPVGTAAGGRVVPRFFFFFLSYGFFARLFRVHARPPGFEFSSKVVCRAGKGRGTTRVAYEASFRVKVFLHHRGKTIVERCRWLGR